jgi:predicted dehydrogenase
MGGWGRLWYAEVLRGFPGLELTACVDSRGEALALARERCGIPASLCVPDLAEALARREADAVLVTASLPGHVPVALAALEAGRHVLLEKPFAPSVAEALSVCEAAERARRIVMVSQNYRHFPAPRLAAEMVRAGEWGRLGAISLDFRRDNVIPDEGRKTHQELPHPLLVDMAIHHFDLLRMVSGHEALRITCSTWNPPWSGYRDPPAGAAIIEMEGGIAVSYRGSWVSPGPITPWAGEWRMEFEGAEVCWKSRSGRDARDDELLLRPYRGRARRMKLPRLARLDRAGALAAFLQAIRTGSEPETSGPRNLGSLALAYAAVESAASGRTIGLRADRSGAPRSPQAA